MQVFKKIFKIITGFILLPIIIVFSLYSLDQQGFFKIDKVEIRIQAQNSQKVFIESQVQRIQQQLDKVKGISLWKAPLHQISKSLSDEKWISKFQITRAWPSGITLDIIPDRVDILVLINSDSKVSASEGTEIKPITSSGIVLGGIKSDSAPNAIISHDTKFLNNKKIRDGALEVIKSLPSEGNMSASQVSEIGYDQKEGYWVKLLRSEIKVQFGEEQFEIKSARITKVIDYLESRDLRARVIEANLSKKVLVRLRQNP